MTWCPVPLFDRRRLEPGPDRRPSRRSVHRAGHGVAAVLLGVELVELTRRGVLIAAPPADRAALVALHCAGRCGETAARYRSAPGPWPQLGGPNRATEGATRQELDAACKAVLRSLRARLPVLLSLARRLDLGEVLDGAAVAAELTATAPAEPAAPPLPPRSTTTRRARRRTDVLGRRIAA